MVSKRAIKEASQSGSAGEAGTSSQVLHRVSGGAVEQRTCLVVPSVEHQIGKRGQASSRDWGYTLNNEKLKASPGLSG